MSQQTIGDWNIRNFPPATQPRKVVIVYQGGIYRARYEGMSNVTFGKTPAQAASALKFFGDQTQQNLSLREKYV
jgi:hypothetical protein